MVDIHYTVLVGLVINPVAGMGGSVALKGTDGAAYQQALDRGAVPVASGRAMRALAGIEDGVQFLTAFDEMGERVLSDLGQDYEVVHWVDGASSGRDTWEACLAFLARKVDLIVFCGGDGTARDVMDAVGENVPVIGIPSGVKMHSGVFANTPEEAGGVINNFLQGGMPTRLAEVMDVDEDAFREGELKARLYGYLQVPEQEGGIQPPKGFMYSSSDDEQKGAIAEYVVETMKTGTLYVLGPGTTTRAVAERMGGPKTLLGVDVYRDGGLVVEDASEEDLLGALVGNEARLILTPIGRQGFVFGRGNQQLSPKVVATIGLPNLQIIATPEKLRETPTLRSDSGDLELDRKMRGYQRVLVGYAHYRMVLCV